MHCSWGAVFCLFSAVGDLALTVLLTGVVAVAWVIALTRHPGFLIAAIPLFVISIARGGEDDPRLPDPDGDLLCAIERRLEIDAAGITLGVVGGYVCFVLFVAREGKRHLRVEAEMSLAREIHRIVAPPIERRIGRFEFYGASVASTEVGGDHEFGLERIKTLVGENADRPLPELFQTLLTAARRHGPQTDDQSLLLVRRT